MFFKNFIYHASWVLPVANAAGLTAVPLVVTNNCRDTVWPGLFSSSGNETGPGILGFELESSSSKTLNVRSDWNGRVWGRTNCTFNDKGVGHCGTGDCGNKLECAVTGETATLAEFNLIGYENQSWYDISLVDGYNLPMAIQVIPTKGIPVPPANETTLICAGSLQGFDADKKFWPYTNSKAIFLGTNSSAPLTFDRKVTRADVSHWCPWDLQFKPMEEVGNYRLPFDPCLSLCSKTRKPEHCCTGNHNSKKTCNENYYSKRAKAICPDAYSFAYDDDTSTFTVPTGTGFEITFCPAGRSTVIKLAMAGAFPNVAPSMWRPHGSQVAMWACTLFAIWCNGLHDHSRPWFG